MPLSALTLDANGSGATAAVLMAIVQPKAVIAVGDISFFQGSGGNAKDGLGLRLTCEDAMLPDLMPPDGTRALIFDCDGTLAITRHAHFAGLHQALAAQGFALSEAWYQDKTGLSLIETCQAYGLDHGVRVDPDALRVAHARVFRTQMPLIRPVDALARVARHFYGRMPMAVASGGDTAIVEATLAQIGLRGLFDPVVAIGEITCGKPAPDLFLRAAQVMQMPAGACLVYEDSDEGLEAARRAGMPAVDVRNIAGVAR